VLLFNFLDCDFNSLHCAVTPLLPYSAGASFSRKPFFFPQEWIVYFLINTSPRFVSRFLLLPHFGERSVPFFFLSLLLHLSIEQPSFFFRLSFSPHLLTGLLPPPFSFQKSRGDLFCASHVSFFTFLLCPPLCSRRPIFLLLFLLRPLLPPNNSR